MRINFWNTPQAKKREAERALVRSTAWQIAKDRGYSNAVFAFPEAITLVKFRKGPEK